MAERKGSSVSTISAVQVQDSTISLIKKVHSFMLFGLSIDMEKERMNGVSSEKKGTFFLEPIKIDKKEESDSRLLFKKDHDCGRKMIDFMGLSKERKDGLSLKDVQELPKYDEISLTDPVLRIGSKKRSRISTSDDLIHHIPCWPTLHKKQRTVRAPNTASLTSEVDHKIGLPLVNAKENHAVNNTSVFPNPHQQLVLLGDHEDPWKIKKVLKKSDVNGSSRLLIGTDMVSRHILPHVWRNANADFDVTKGTEVVIWDMDTGSRHKLTLKRWKSKSFVFVGGWTSDFVKRRNLKENDEIALKWDDSNSMLEFTLLHRKH